jgi:hypothetical protein
MSVDTEVRAGPQKEDPTAKVGAAGAHLVGLRLSKEQKPFASRIVHYAFGASVGAVYGAVAEMVPRVTAAWGFLSGVRCGLGPTSLRCLRSAWPTVRPEDTLRAAGISTRRQARYQRRMSSLLAGR